MDPEIWSQADFRNGGRLFAVLVLLILVKEIGILVAPFLGFPSVISMWPADVAPDAFPGFRDLVLFCVKLLLVLFIYGGIGWARPLLGLIYLGSSAYGLYLAGIVSAESDVAMLSLGNGILGLLIGWVLIGAEPLRAFVSGRSSGARLTIPIPSDDERPPIGRRGASLDERLGMGLRLLRTFLILLIPLALLAYAYDLHKIVLRWLGY